MKAILVLAAVLGLGLHWKVIAIAPSGPPLDVVAVPKSPRSVLVTWADVPVEEQNGALTEYEILYEQSTLSEIAQSRSVRVGAGEEDEATLVDLEEFVEYMISVRAYNGDGGGPYSAPVSVTTYQDVPSAAPRNFTLTATAASELMLTWDRPSEIDINGILTFYSVRYHVVGTSEFRFVPVFGGDAQHLVLEDLDNYTTYEVLIAANTVNGSGPTISSTGMTRENVPEASPQNISANATSSSNILVRWEPPDQVDWNGVLRGYQLQYIPLDPSIPTSPQQLTDLLSPNTTSYLLQDLEPSTVYCIQVAAVTVDRGPFSPPLCVATLEGSGGSGEGSAMSSRGSYSSYGALVPTATPAGGTSSTGAGNTATIVAVSVAGGLVVVGAIGVVVAVVVVALLLRRHRARYKLRQKMSHPRNLAATNPQLVFTDSNTREHTAVDNPQYGPVSSLCFANPAMETIQVQQNRAYGHGSSAAAVTSSDEDAGKVADNPQYRRFLPQGEQYLLPSRTLDGEYDYPTTSFQRHTGAPTEDSPYSEVKTTEPPYATIP